MKLIGPELLRERLLRREDASHKGDYGHLLLVCGCDTMPGAAVLATGAALKSGCGLVTLHSTESACQAAVPMFPSAMLSRDSGCCFSQLPANLEKYSCIGAGPGLGKAEQSRNALSMLLEVAQGLSIPMVLDADALNIISENRRLLDSIPAGSVLTPHIGELKRILPGWRDGDDGMIQELCENTGCILVRKGFHTQVFTPSGEIFTNTTGNPGMAKGGSGDVLTGLLAGLIARGYDSLTAAVLAVWVHGFTGDHMTATCTAEAYSSLDLIPALPLAFRELYR